MWFPNELHQEISSLSLENIEFLRENGTREGIHLEYKLKYIKSLRESICAFMNTDGGWIILGVEESDEKIVKIQGIQSNFIEEFRKCFAQFDPYVEWDFDLNFKEISLKNDLFLYIIRIPKTNHSIKLSGVYYVRIGAESIKLIKDSDINKLKQRKSELDALGREIIRYLKLPKKDYSDFIGRKEIYKDIMDELKGHRYIISIDGIGGVGKSTLALEIAYEVYEQHLFDSVLWFSAKKEKFIYSQITSIEAEFNNLDNLLERIAFELKISNFERFSKSNKIDTIIKILKDNSILLNLDNLETIDLTKSFIDFLAKIEGKSKVLITSRKRLGQLERIINLEAFNQHDTTEFIELEAESRSYILPEPKKDIYKKLYELTEGIPLAIKVMMGWLVRGDPITQLENQLKFSEDNILNFCFKETYDKCLSEESKQILCIFSFLPNVISDEEIKACTDINLEKIQNSLNELLNYSLISKINKFEEDNDDLDYYKMLPLTQLFAQEKLKDFKNLERQTLKKYNNFIEEKRQYLININSFEPEKKLAGLNQKQKNAYLKALQASGAFERGDYVNAQKLFIDADKISDDVPEIYYMWGKVEMSLGHLRKTDEIFKRAVSLDPNNSTYWLTWASFHKQHKSYKQAMEILHNALEKVSKENTYMLIRELGIIASYAEEFQYSLEILKNNLILNPSNENDYFLNTKMVSSILHTYILQAQHNIRNKQFYISKKKLNDALKFHDEIVNIINFDDPGLIWRIKRIYLSLANEFVRKDFKLSMDYFSKAYYEEPLTEREKEHNKSYFLPKWQFFVNHWIKYGKKKEEFIDIFKNDDKNLRFC